MARMASRAVSEDSFIMSQISILAAQFSDANAPSVAASVNESMVRNALVMLFKNYLFIVYLICHFGK